MTKTKNTIIDCKDIKDIYYASNLLKGFITFINAENLKGIEFGIGQKVIGLDLSSAINLKYLNIHRTNIKEINDVLPTCMVYCNAEVVINRKSIQYILN
jgi:hypothetical protein